MSSETAERRSKLSPERQALLAKRLSSIAAGVAKAPGGGQEGPAAPAAVPAPDQDLGRELTRDPGAPSPLSPDLWRELVAAGERAARYLEVAPDLVADAAREAQLDAQAAVFLSAALRRLGIFQRVGEEQTLDSLTADHGILPKYRKVLRRWLEELREEGLVEPVERPEREGETWIAREPLPPPALDALITAEQRTYYGDHLAAVLTGRLHPLELYLPGGSSTAVESSYRELPIFRYCNGISAAILETQARALPPGARLRILEVGAGTGGTTASLLPLLPAERTVYHFTDVSKFFTDLGRKKFHDLPFLRCRELDLEQDPALQGYPPASFDWVVAAHVLHATRDVATTLAHVRSLLAPGGVLLLLEETRFQRKYNFSMGFLPGFDSFEDVHLRPLHPLLSAGQWCDALRAAGFAEAAAFTAPGSAAEVLGVDVLLARLPGGEAAPGAAQPASFGQRRLWHFARRQPASLACNVDYAVGLRGPLDEAVLMRSVRSVVERHGALHTRFEERAGEVVAVAAPELIPAGVPLVDLTAVRDLAAREAEGWRLPAELATPPFDLGRGPLLRTALVRAAPGQHSLLLAVHHAVIDGWSLALFTRDLAAAYPALAAGRPPFSEPSPLPSAQSADIARRQLRRVREGDLAEDLAWWRRYLAGAPAAGLVWPARPHAPGGRWDPLESTCRHASLSIL